MTIDADGLEPPTRAAQLRSAVGAATGQLRQTAAGISDQQASEPSALPGWSRGHVLAHLARNADGLRNLLIWARTGIETPQYASPAAREEEIEAGAGLPAAELLADVDATARLLDDEAGRLPDAAWAAQVSGIFGNKHPAWYTLWRRLSEVEFHHVDLAAGYQPAAWPEEFAVYGLQRVGADFAGPRSPAVLLRCSDVAAAVQIGPPDIEAAVTVTGPVRSLLAWLSGRGQGDGLIPQPGGLLPKLPSW